MNESNEWSRENKLELPRRVNVELFILSIAS